MHRYVWQCECINYLYSVIVVLYGTEWQGRLDRDVFHEPVLFRMSCFILKEPVISKELLLLFQELVMPKSFFIKKRAVLLQKSCFILKELFYS